MRLVTRKRRFQMNSRWVARASPRPAWQSGDRRRGPRRAFRFTLYSTLCVVSRAPRVRRERWLQVLDGMRRQRAAYVRVPTAPCELDFVGLASLLSFTVAENDILYYRGDFPTSTHRTCIHRERGCMYTSQWASMCRHKSTLAKRAAFSESFLIRRAYR